MLEEVEFLEVESGSDSYNYVNTCLQRYMTAMKDEDEPVLSSIKKTENNILEGKAVEETSNIVIQKAYEVRNIAGSFFFVQAVLDGEESIYCMLNLDYTNNAFSIQSLTKTDFEEIENGRIEQSYQTYLPVEKNQYNKFQ